MAFGPGRDFWLEKIDGRRPPRLGRGSLQGRGGPGLSGRVGPVGGPSGVGRGEG